MDFRELHGLQIMICKYCRNLKTIQNFKSNYGNKEFTISCIDCRKKADNYRKTNYIKYYCDVCNCHLTSPKKLMGQCIKQHFKTRKHHQRYTQNN